MKSIRQQMAFNGYGYEFRSAIWRAERRFEALQAITRVFTATPEGHNRQGRSEQGIFNTAG